MISRLREALANPPVGCAPLKRTSVPSTVTLEQILTRAQNKLRRPAAPTTLLGRVLDWLR